MTRLVEYNWIAAGSNTGAVCTIQSLDAGGNLALNGTFASAQYPGMINLLAVGGTSRTISITSTADLSGVIFVVNGYQNGVAVTSGNITGPNNNITSYVNDVIFDTITSVTANLAAANVSVGIGKVGYYPLIEFNYGDSHHYREGSHMRGWALAYSSLPVVVQNNGITPIVYGSVADATIIGLSYQDTFNVANFTTFFQLIEVFVGAIATGNFIMTNNYRFLNQILVQGTDNSDNGTSTGRLDFRDT